MPHRPKPKSIRPRDGRFVNTKMCTYHQTGECRKGEACGFAHTVDDLHKRPSLYRSYLCLDFFQRGSCPYGASCQYSHDRQEFPEQAGDQDTQDMVFDIALYADSISSSPACVQNLLSAVGDSTPVLGRDDPHAKEAKNNLKSYWAVKKSAEAHQYTASSQETWCFSDVGTNSLESESGDDTPLAQRSTDNLVVSKDEVEFPVQKTFIHFNRFPDRNKLRRARSADGRDLCVGMTPETEFSTCAHLKVNSSDASAPQSPIHWSSPWV